MLSDLHSEELKVLSKISSRTFQDHPDQGSANGGHGPKSTHCVFLCGELKMGFIVLNDWREKKI